jgi:hypothetical protein
LVNTFLADVKTTPYAVRREALHDVGARMPRQPLRRSAADGDDVDVGVAVELRAERDRLAVGRERGVRDFSFARRESSDVGAHERGGPQVARIHERNMIDTDRGLREQARIGGAGADTRPGLDSGQQQRDGEKRQKTPRHECTSREKRAAFYREAGGDARLLPRLKTRPTRDRDYHM